MTLPEFLELKEYVDCMEAIEEARNKDHSDEMERQSQRNR